MLELLQRAVTLEWRLRGAVIREIPIAGSRVWYAEFQPCPSDRRALRKAAGGEARGRLEVPTLVLFHGLGASSTSYHAVIPHLRRAYRVVVPDLPGCGLSKPPRGRQFLSFQELVEVAEKFVARVAPRGAYVAGNSMGGWIATKLAAPRTGSTSPASSWRRRRGPWRSGWAACSTGPRSPCASSCATFGAS